MQKEISNEASRWAYAGVSVLAGVVCFVSIYLFVYLIQRDASFPDPFRPLLFSSIFIYLIMTASFVAIYSGFPSINPVKSIPWIIAIYFIGLIFSFGKYYAIIKELRLDNFQYYTIVSAHLAGFFLFIFTFFFWARQWRDRTGVDKMASPKPSMKDGNTDSVSGQLPYKAPENRAAIGFNEDPARLSKPAPKIPIAKRPKPLGHKPQPTVSDLVELLSSRKSQLDELRGQYPKASKAIEYLSEAREALEDIQDLPDNHIETFLEAMDADPTSDPAEQAELVKQAYDKELNPFKSQEMNAAFAEAREIGRIAAREFLEVAGIFGDRLSPSDILEKIHEKFQVHSPVLYDLLNASKIFDPAKMRESIEKLGYKIEFTESDRGTKKYVIRNPETGREILRGNLTNIRSHMLQNPRILNALRITDDLKRTLLRIAQIEEDLGVALKSFNEKRIVNCLEALKYKVERSPLPDRQHFEIIDPKSGSRTIVEDFVSLREFAENVLRFPLDNFDTRKKPLTTLRGRESPTS